MIVSNQQVFYAANDIQNTISSNVEPSVYCDITNDEIALKQKHDFEEKQDKPTDISKSIEEVYFLIIIF